MTLEWKPELDDYLRKAWDGRVSIEAMAEHLNTLTEHVRARLKVLLGVDTLPRRGLLTGLAREWTAKEDRRILGAWEADVPLVEIGGMVGRAEDTVGRRLKYLLGVDVLPSRKAPRASKIKVLGPPASVLGAASARSLARRRARRAG